MNPEWREFFEDDITQRGSMNRLATFVAVTVLSAGFFCLILMCIGTTGMDLQQKLGALTTIGIILAGLGGFNYAAGRAAGAYTQVRCAQGRTGTATYPSGVGKPSSHGSSGS